MSIASKAKKSKELSSVAKTIPHLIIEARAGTGKTTTLIEGLKKLKDVPSDHPAAKNPSSQQKTIWDVLLLSKVSAKTVAFVAFNKSIADELKSRVPPGCNAMTSHGLGRSAVADAFGNGSCRLNADRTQDIISEIWDMDIWELRKEMPVFLRGVCDLVDLCKQNLVDAEDVEELDKLATYYDVELDKFKSEVYDMVPKVLDRSKDVAKDKCISFSDMIWLPVALDLPVTQYDLLLVDEAQDLNRCQQALVRKAGKRLVLCGDPKQAIYGFAGADALSMSRMLNELNATPQGCKLLPLNMTRRCGKAIVAEANAIVPDFYACEENCKGSVRKRTFKGTTSYRHEAIDGDMVLCRVNAPLVSECFKFLKAGQKANIQGRDVGQGLIKTVKSLEKKSSDKPFTLRSLTKELGTWLYNEEKKEQDKRHPSEARILALQDRHDCLMCFAEEVNTVPELIAKIESIFSDDKRDGIRLSSVHKAKGLEARRVYILLPKGAGMPHPMATAEWEIEQEWNLKYVAITRAIEELVYVESDDDE